MKVNNLSKQKTCLKPHEKRNRVSDNFFMLGMSWIALEQPRLALPYLQRCTELNDEDGEALFSIWTLFSKSGVY